MEQGIQEKINQLCSFVCNGKTYQYEQKLHKAAEHELYDAAIIYAWNIFMLFVYEKIWQIREIEKIGENPFKTDKVFLELTKNKPDNFFDGNLFSLNKLHENKQGEDIIISKLKEVYKETDQQIFKTAQQVLQKRNTAAHVNSINQEEEDLVYVIRELIKITDAIQNNHNKILDRIFIHIESNKIWYFSEEDMQYVNNLFSQENVDRSKYAYIAKLISTQEFSSDVVNNIKDTAIEYFLQSNSWDFAYKNAQELIKPLIQFFDIEDIKRILIGVFDKRGHTYNQILGAGGIEKIFWELYHLSINNFPEIQSNWSNFATKLESKGYKNNFKQLIQEIKIIKF